ncbi:hypothetical protein Q4Q39_18795 [Flavivirga amylovorans]|uniref:Lipocalin-like domain-containing protein n=1 Tax=Flavivirga amylovorans TaxID=870486 RepID=A0ABT8X633_9FLAO|nr:hypothetical protein [Flavivirga amylovorans]MDO5989458.1 hypothetical protein [Flavivirga amylovorans]
MKKGILIFLSLVLINCTSDDSKPKEEDSELLGKWKLIEQLSDPGDGSGVFNSIDSNRTIEFFSNGTVTINGILCFMSSQVGDESSGTYSAVSGSDFSDGEIIPNDCDSNFVEPKVFYKIEGANLILWYLCIEPCGQKFIKLPD